MVEPIYYGYYFGEPLLDSEKQAMRHKVGKTPLLKMPVVTDPTLKFLAPRTIGNVRYEK